MFSSCVQPTADSTLLQFDSPASGTQVFDDGLILIVQAVGYCSVAHAVVVKHYRCAATRQIATGTSKTRSAYIYFYPISIVFFSPIQPWGMGPWGRRSGAVLGGRSRSTWHHGWTIIILLGHYGSPRKERTKQKSPMSLQT